jgi:NADH-quinone oxidoreductase subunit M
VANLEQHLLSWIVFLPLVGVLALLVLPRLSNVVVRGIAVGILILDFLLSLRLLQGFEKIAGMQFVERVDWIPQFGISYWLGVDGISLWLVLLTTFLGPVIVLSTFNAVKERVREFMVFFLALQTAMLGTFCAQDLVLFYIFWESVLLPMALMIGMC